MGNKQFQYSLPIGEQQDGETHVYRHPKYLQGLNTSFKGCKTMQEIFIGNATKFSENNLLGKQVTDENNIKSYVFKSYAVCYELAQQLGSGIIKLNLIPNVREYEGRKMKLIGVFSKNREEWLLLEFANFLYGNTMVPLNDSIGHEGIPYILLHSEMETIFCSAKSVSTLTKVNDIGNLKNIVTFDPLTEDIELQIKEKGISLFKWQDVIDAGIDNIQEYAEVKPEDVFTFSYTSGTTGDPKCAMITNLNLMVTAASPDCRDIIIDEYDVHLSYLPLSHVFERLMSLALIGYGATICFYSGDVMKLNQDIALAKPTIFVSVPRLYQKLHQIINDKIDNLKGYRKTMIDYALSVKKQNLKNSGSVYHRLWDKIVFNRTRNALGGRVKFMVSASAPLSGDIVDYLKIVVCCPFVEGYGSTESTGASFLTHPNDPVSNHIGGPMSHTEFKLVDIPELNYTCLDRDEQDRLSPRGEICMRGPAIFPGYYKDQVKTNEVIDKDGWYHSGDVGQLLSNGSVRIIDRKKNIFKLSQGEYIAPEKIENIYLMVKGVKEIFVYGDSHQSYCVAIIVPNQDIVESYAQSMNIAGDFTELCDNKDVQQYFLKELQDRGKQAGLNGMENVKKISLAPKSFIEYGCMTDTMKLQRHIAKGQFKKVLDDLYKE